MLKELQFEQKINFMVDFLKTHEFNGSNEFKNDSEIVFNHLNELLFKEI